MITPRPLCKVTVTVIAAAGFFVYFDSMVLAAAEQGGDCEEDYVQVSTVQYGTVQYSTV